MRKMGFVGFLKKYISDVSGVNSLSIHKLVKLSKKNHRLFDSLLLYCVITNRKELFNKYTNNQFYTLVEELKRDNFLDERFLDYDFKKIWEAYLTSNKRIDYENEFKSKLRESILEKMKANKISKYRVYTDLKLNPGNVNDYLTNGNCKKVSLDVGKSIYHYVNRV